MMPGMKKWRWCNQADADCVTTIFSASTVFGPVFWHLYILFDDDKASWSLPIVLGKDPAALVGTAASRPTPRCNHASLLLYHQCAACVQHFCLGVQQQQQMLWVSWHFLVLLHSQARLTLYRSHKHYSTRWRRNSRTCFEHFFIICRTHER